jgi:hypothetical protein
MTFWAPQVGDAVTTREIYEGAIIETIKPDPKFGGGGEAILFYPPGSIGTPRVGSFPDGFRSRVAIGALRRVDNGVVVDVRGKL